MSSAFLTFKYFSPSYSHFPHKKSKFKNGTDWHISLLRTLAGKEITLFTLSFPPAFLSNGNRRHLFFSYYFFYLRYIFIVYLFPFCHVNYFEAEKVSKLRVFSYLRRIFIFLQQYAQSIDNQNMEEYSEINSSFRLFSPIFVLTTRLRKR